MTTQKEPFAIVIPLYPGVDLMDVAAPSEMFYWMGTKTPRLAVSVRLVAATAEVISTLQGVKLTPDATFEEMRHDGSQCQLLWVPGGEPASLKARMRDPKFLEFLRQQSRHARFVTSVCEGALLLASAGLLDGYRATTHWAFIPCLKAFPRIEVADGTPRYVVDRNRVTGGGISSGLDEALELIIHIAGRDVAIEVQQLTQYLPVPPVCEPLPPPGTCPLAEV